MKAKKCKHCTATFEKFTDLRGHVMWKHPAEYSKLKTWLSEFDHIHPEAASKTCAICAHRKGGGHG